jgi:methylglutaconyl-CoA hydratase
LIPATIGPYVVARIGEAMARRVVLSGRRFDAKEAERLGLLARVVAPEDLEASVEDEIAPFLMAAPGAIADAKAQLRRLGPKIDDATIADSVEALVRRWDGAEAPEGIAAFFERRPPAWAGTSSD